MNTINLEHDDDIKTLNIDISNLSDTNDSLSFTKENEAEPISIDSIKFDTNNNDIKPPNLSSFDKKDIQFGLDLLENPNKKKKVMKKV